MTDEIESREDILITRILDGESCQDDLRDLFALAAADASLWDRFEAAKRDRDAFALAVDEALSVADRVAGPGSLPGRFRAASLCRMDGLGRGGGARPRVVLVRPAASAQQRPDRTRRAARLAQR